MANVVNNLRVNNKEVKKIFLNNKILKELYFNNVLIWKNANPFVFVKSLSDIDIAAFGENTIIFENFSPKQFIGSYNIVESTTELPNEVGQMIVVEGEKD